MRKILPVNSLQGERQVTGPPGTFEEKTKQSIVEVNPQSNSNGHRGRQLLSFLKQLATGTVFLSGSDGSNPSNHLASSSSEYRALMQESERENKL